MVPALNELVLGKTHKLTSDTTPWVPFTRSIIFGSLHVPARQEDEANALAHSIQCCVTIAAHPVDITFNAGSALQQVLLQPQPRQK